MTIGQVTGLAVATVAVRAALFAPPRRVEASGFARIQAIGVQQTLDADVARRITKGTISVRAVRYVQALDAAARTDVAPRSAAAVAVGIDSTLIRRATALRTTRSGRHDARIGCEPPCPGRSRLTRHGRKQVERTRVTRPASVLSDGERPEHDDRPKMEPARRRGAARTCHGLPGATGAGLDSA